MLACWRAVPYLGTFSRKTLRLVASFGCRAVESVSHPIPLGRCFATIRLDSNFETETETEATLAVNLDLGLAIV